MGLSPIGGKSQTSQILAALAAVALSQSGDRLPHSLSFAGVALALVAAADLQLYGAVYGSGRSGAAV